MAKVLFSRGLSTVYTGLAEKQADTIYFLTDTQQIYLGEQLIADTTKLNVQFVDAVPEFDTAKEDVLYVVTGADGGIYIKGDSAMDQVSGGEATSVADGTITFDSLNSELVATELTGDSTDRQLPTAKAVYDAVQAVAADVDALGDPVTGASAERNEGNNGTVITLTRASGTNPITVNVSDLFLTSAEYDSAFHKLKLYVQGVSDPVEVDLSTLIGNSLSDVTVGDDETFTVELGEGGTLGGYKTGDPISADTSIETIIKKLLMKQVPPTYTEPSISIANNGGSASGSYEIGTEVTPNVRATFTQHDAGALTNIQFKKGVSNVGEAQTSSPATYTEAAFTLETATSFSATATYAEGAIKDDNLGEPYEEGHIAAGSKTSSNFTFTPYRQGYFVGSTENKDAIDSAVIRGLASKKNGAYSSGTVKFTVPVGAQRVIIACPATNSGVTKVINESALNADVTSTFTKSQVDVEGASGYAAISYNVWTFVPDVPYGQEADLAFTLG